MRSCAAASVIKCGYALLILHTRTHAVSHVWCAMCRYVDGVKIPEKQIIVFYLIQNFPLCDLHYQYSCSVANAIQSG